MARLTKLNRSVSGRVAIVTGAASGMGRATAMLFADEGARVAICDVNAEPLKEVERAIRDNRGDVHAWTPVGPSGPPSIRSLGCRAGDQRA